MDCGLLRVTRAGASEPGWPVCVVTRVTTFHVVTHVVTHVERAFVTRSRA